MIFRLFGGHRNEIRLADLISKLNIKNLGCGDLAFALSKSIPIEFRTPVMPVTTGAHNRRRHTPIRCAIMDD